MMSCVSIFSISSSEYPELSRGSIGCWWGSMHRLNTYLTISSKLTLFCVMMNPNHQQERRQMLLQTKRAWDNYNHSKMVMYCCVALPKILICWRGLSHHALQPQLLCISLVAISEHHCSWLLHVITSTIKRTLSWSLLQHEFIVDDCLLQFS